MTLEQSSGTATHNNGELSFSGGGFASLPDITLNSNWTVEVLLKDPSTDPDYQRYWLITSLDPFTERWYSGANDKILIYQMWQQNPAPGDNMMGWEAYSSGTLGGLTKVTSYIATNSVDVTTYKHYVWTFDSNNNQRFYLDGIEISPQLYHHHTTGPAEPSRYADNTSGLKVRLGAGMGDTGSTDQAQFSGECQVKLFNVYNTALTASAVSYLYSNI